MNGSVIREPSRSLKEQFLRNYPARGLQSPKQKYRPLVIVLAATIFAGLALESTEKIFGRKLCLGPKKTVKRGQPPWVIRKVVFTILICRRHAHSK